MLAEYIQFRARYLAAHVHTIPVEERTIAGLARRMGLSYSDLRSRLTRSPAPGLSLQAMESLAAGLRVSVLDLVVGFERWRDIRVAEAAAAHAADARLASGR
jgi:hypothetical protein